MKKILLLIIIWILTSLVTITSATTVYSATVLLDENFSGTFPPDGWSTDWWTQCNIGCGIEPPCACLLPNQYENNSAYINSKAVNASEYGICKVTGLLDADISYPCCFYIKFKTNETSPWNDITPWDNPVGPGWMGGYIETWIINSTEGCGEALQIKFEYIGDSNDNSFCLDDVKILGGENQPPTAPTIYGETSGKAGEEYEYTFNATDPDGDDVKYFIDWGDYTSEWTDYYASGIDVKVIHMWNEAGTYNVTGKAQDIYGAEGPEETLSVNMVPAENQPPGAPTIKGEISGKTGTEYEYTFNATDPDGDDVKYYIEWGDNTPYETDFNASGTEVMVKHKWNKKGNYTITAKAEDINGAKGPEGTLTLTIPRVRVVYHSFFLWFLDRFPLLERLLSLFK